MWHPILSTGASKAGDAGSERILSMPSYTALQLLGAALFARLTAHVCGAAILAAAEAPDRLPAIARAQGSSPRGREPLSISAAAFSI